MPRQDPCCAILGRCCFVSGGLPGMISYRRCQSVNQNQGHPSATSQLNLMRGQYLFESMCFEHFHGGLRERRGDRAVDATSLFG